MSTSRIAPRPLPTTAPQVHDAAEVRRSTNDDPAAAPPGSTTSTAGAPVAETRAPASPTDVRSARRKAMHDAAGQHAESRVRGALDERSGPSVSGSGAPTTRALTERVRSLVERISSDEAAEGPWTAPDGMCLDLAAKWQQRLSQEGLSVRIATVDPLRREPGTPVTRGLEGKFHAYAVVEVEGADPVVVDASWRQFVKDGAHKPELEGTFVGTTDELVQRLTPHAPSRQVEIHDDPLLGRREPRQTVELAYGLGPHARMREILAP